MKKIFIAAPIWIALIIFIALWEYYHELNLAEKLIRNEAITHLARDKAFRYWASDHGGVYVPVTEELSPSPYLEHIPTRDVTSSDGLDLTLMNPAWMLRQLMSEYEELYGVKGHITSLNPLREGNAPDEWEVTALQAFDQGEQEFGEFSEIDGVLHYRFMKPLVTVDRCLNCHAFQGYEAGDVRGGVSVSVSTEPYYEATNDVIGKMLTILIILGISGLIAMFILFRFIDRQKSRQVEAEQEVAKLQEMLLLKDRMAAVDNLSSGMAHEINNPLAGIIQAANVLSSRFNKKIDSRDNKEAAKDNNLDIEAVKDFLESRGMSDMLDIIVEGGHRIADIIQNLTAYASSESGLEESKSPVDYIRKSLQLIEEFYVGKDDKAENVEVILNTDDSLPYMKGLKLQQALFNIILNAYQNLLENDISDPQIQIKAVENRDKGTLDISIKDNGSGISEDDKKRILDPFFTTREVGEGKGLGLSVAYYIVTKVYKGDVIIDSHLGKGSEITLRIPLSTSL